MRINAIHIGVTAAVLWSTGQATMAQTWENLEARVPACTTSVFKTTTEAGRAHIRVTRPRMCKALEPDRFEVMYVNTATPRPCREVVRLDHMFVSDVQGLASACGVTPTDKAKDYSETYAKRDAIDAVVARKNLSTSPWWVECDANWDENCRYIHRVAAPEPFEYCGHTVGEIHRNKPGASEWSLGSFRFDGFLVTVKSHGSKFFPDQWGSRIRMGGTFRMIRAGFAPEVKNQVCAADGYQWMTPGGQQGKSLVGMRCEYSPSLRGSPVPGMTGTQYCEYSDGSREVCGICYGNSFP